MEALEQINLIILTWMAVMLSIQSWILYKLLPEIKKMANNSDIFNIFKVKKKDGSKHD